MNFRAFGLACAPPLRWCRRDKVKQSPPNKNKGFYKMTYSQIFQDDTKAFIEKLNYFSKFASHFIKSVRDTFGVEIDITTNKHFFIFTVSLYADDMSYLIDIAHINIYNLHLIFLADSFLIDDGNTTKFNKLFVDLFNSEAK